MALARWKDLCIDASDPSLLGGFWAAALGLTAEVLADGDVVLRGATPTQTIWVNGVPEPRTVKQRVHLDLEVRSLDALLALGASVELSSSDSGFAWDVLADPEGGELCAFVRQDTDPSPPARLYEMVVATANAAAAHAAAAWWALVLGGSVVDDDRGFSWVEQVPDVPFATIDFVPVPEPKTVKNRIHWDVIAAEPDRLLDHGATLLAAPTTATQWHVMADPQGNEFCCFLDR